MITPSCVSCLTADFVHAGRTCEWSADAPARNRAHGQHKLFYMDLAALLQAFAVLGDATAMVDVVVAGAGPGYHFNDLIGMFSARVRWHLYDPGYEGNAICESVQRRAMALEHVHVHTGADGLMTVESARSLRGRVMAERPSTSILFLSDIRTVPARAAADFERQRRTYERRDMQLQRELTEALLARFAMLKMKIPYPDGAPAAEHSFHYYAGVPFVQPYARAMSTEFRLFVSRGGDGTCPTTAYNKKHVEGAWSYYNRVTRPREDRDATIVHALLYLYDFNVLSKPHDAP